MEDAVNACPGCGEGISRKALAHAVLPIWVTCRNCKTRLVGNQVVQVVAVGQTVLATGIALAATLWVPFLVAMSEPEFSVPFPDPGTLVFIGVMIFVIWLAGVFLARPFGRYAAIDENPAGPLVVRNYLLATAIASVVVLSWAIIYAGINPVAPALRFAWAFALLLVLYPLFNPREAVRLGQALAVALLLWAGIFNLSAIVFAAYAGANYPKEQAFEERLTFTFGPPSQQETWYRLRDMLSVSEPDREETLEHLAQNVVSVPTDAVSYSGGPISWGRLLSMNAEETAEIQELLDQANDSAARNRYLRLWRVADNLLSGKGSLLQHLTAVSLVKELVDLHLDDNNRARLSVNGELLAVSEAMAGRLDDSFASALSLEHLRFKRLLCETAEEGCLSLGTLCLTDLPWPFFDKHKTLRADHDSWSTLLASSREPLSRVQSGVGSNSAKESEWARFSKLKNPLGFALGGITVPYLGRFIEYPQLTKARLSIFRYVLEAEESGGYGNIPIEPMTGEPFVVTDLGDSLEIRSAYLKDGEPAIRYQIDRNPH